MSKTCIFQIKSNLHNIRKGTDIVSQYILKIKKARDYLSVVGVYFADEDIVILEFNCLPSEYNIFRCRVRGRESIITLKEFLSQLLAEEKIVENIIPDNLHILLPCIQFLNVMFHPHHFFNHLVDNMDTTLMIMVVLKPSIGVWAGVNLIKVKEVFHREHNFMLTHRIKCNIYGKPNHITWYCFYNEIVLILLVLQVVLQLYPPIINIMLCILCIMAIHLPNSLQLRPHLKSGLLIWGLRIT